MVLGRGGVLVLEADGDGAGVCTVGVGVSHTGAGTAVGAVRGVGEVVHADIAGGLGQESLRTAKQPVMLDSIAGGSQEQDEDQGTGESEDAVIGHEPVMGNGTEGSEIIRVCVVGKDAG